MDEMEKKTDKPGRDHGEEPRQVPEAQHPGETIGSLMAECEELSQEIGSEKERLERFMLETGGASDASDRIQEGIDSLKDMLAEKEGCLQALFDEQEKLAFAPKEKAAGKTSVLKDLSEKKAEIAIKNPPEKETGRKSPDKDMGR